MGGKGVNAIIEEMNRFHYREVGHPLLSKEITYEAKKKSLSYLMFLKKNEMDR